MRNLSFISAHYGIVPTCDRKTVHSIWTILISVFLTVPSFAQNHVSYTYDSAGNRDSRTWTTGSFMARHGSDSLFPVQIPITPDTLSIKSVRTKVSLDPNNLPLVLSEDEKSWLNDEYFKSQMAEEEAWWKEYEKQPRLRSTNTNYSVGAIPLQEGISPTGARTYSLPIPTAAGFKLVPNISLAYNSQAAEGWAGYGWDIQGLSCIRLINKNQYYHGEIKAADALASDPVFALDGIPLVTNEHPETSSAYPLETARGHILAAPEYNRNHRIFGFKVLYPNGVRATYGRVETYNYNMVIYYVTQMEDLEGNKITFTYSIDAHAGLDRPESILYGYDSNGNPAGQISFSYTFVSSAATRYFAGKAIEYDYRLSAIESRTDGEILARYDFTYEQKDNACLLSKVDCSSGNYSLSPLEFTYGTPPTSSYIKQDRSCSIDLDPTVYSIEDENVFKRGKFMRNEYRDGVIIYCKNPTTSSRISLIPRLESSSTLNTDIPLGPRFKTVEAADVDGDGVDEIIHLSTWYQSAMSAIGISVYKCNDSGTPVLQYQNTALVPGTYSFFSLPYSREYRMGDFDGDGKAELLAVAYNRSGTGAIWYSQVSYTSLIDVSTGTLLCNQELFEFPHDRSTCLIVNDIDNDGRAELCYATDTGFNIYRLQASGSFALEKTLANPTASFLASEARPCYMADLNGDGYLDIIRAPSPSSSTIWDIYSYNGNTFVWSPISLTSCSSNDQVMFIDINRDGLADFVKVSGTSIYSCRNINGLSFDSPVLSPSTISNTSGIVPVNASAYNKSSSFIKIDGTTVYNYSYNAISPFIRRVNMVVDSYGKRLRNGYTYLPSHAQIWRDSSLSVDTTQCFFFSTLPLYVLSSEYSYMSGSSSSSYDVKEYEYYNGVVHNRGLGFCGFSRIRVKEKPGTATFHVDDAKDTYYLPDKMGVVSKVVCKKGVSQSDPAYYTLTNTWDSHSTTYGKLSPRLTQSVAVDALTGVRSQTSYTYDAWDFPTESRTSQSVSGHGYQYEKHRLTYQHSNSASKYVLGSVTVDATTQNLDSDTEYQWKEKTMTTLDALFRPVSTKYYKGKCYCPSANPFFEASDSTRLTGETKWTYDSHGNVLTEKSAPYNATEFIGHTYTYDSNGRYCLTDTDALGHTTTYVNYNKFGKPFRVDDYRNRSTYYSYDAFGRITTVRRIDSSIEATAYAWGGEGAYTVTKTDVSSGASTVTHYDALDREVRRGSKRFDGQWQYTDTKYNRNGQVSQSSLPFKGSTPTYWNTYSYDTYHRPTKIAEASGKETTWSYSGTSVTTVKDGITSVSTKDASGHVVSVQDAGGTITYTLRDDGQPSKITAPGNVETIFAYDNYGRRTSINDPSAGTRTEAYVWNSDGSHQQTHTGPNGSITTSWDKYGRTTSVVRPGEFNTTYTYNTYGLLSNEQSTNGTGTEYTYDSYDRIATVKETVPDSKWLKKTYTYGSWGNVSTIKYTTQGGDITTETYSYANGNNTGVSITGGTTVWSLVEENDLGLPTEITTGSVTREYGFTDFGLPTYRKMGGGNLQSFTYNFNVNTGNLTSRTDVVNNKTETFIYDGLNRLRYFGNRLITHTPNGNIQAIGGVGTLSYANADKPYQVTHLMPASTDLVPARSQEVTYNSLDRPSVLEEGDKTASFTYKAAGDRVKMQVTNGVTQELTRYYIGGQYECDTTASGTKERLYLAGDAYSAPMVLQRVNNGSWTAYNIGRDYLGNITHIATTSGALVAEYSYDPWGRLRNPSTLAIYTPGNEPELFLGRGYTGHEHLTWFGLINMNARLYDPLLGRFLSPDPHVQAPDFTQNFNRYSYALNNPLRYKDSNGEEFIVGTMLLIGAICATVFGVGNIAAHAIRGEDMSHLNWIEPFMSGFFAGFAVGALGYAGFSGMTALAGMHGFWGGVGKTLLYGTIGTGLANTGATITSFVGGAITHGGEGLANAGKIFLGNFYLDENKPFWGQVGEGILRHTWQAPQQAIGYFWSSARNTAGAIDRVDYLGGATFATREYSDGSGISFGSFLNINDTGAIKGSFEDYVTHDPLYMHEYGHYIDSQRFGPTYLFAIGLPSAISALRESGGNSPEGFWTYDHSYYWAETRANKNAAEYFGKYYGVNWNNDKYLYKSKLRTLADGYPL